MQEATIINVAFYIMVTIILCGVMYLFLKDKISFTEMIVLLIVFALIIPHPKIKIKTTNDTKEKIIQNGENN